MSGKDNYQYLYIEDIDNHLQKLIYFLFKWYLESKVLNPLQLFFLQTVAASGRNPLEMPEHCYDIGRVIARFVNKDLKVVVLSM